MQSYDKWADERFANTKVKTLYLTPPDFVAFKVWIKLNTSDHTTYEGRYEQHYARHMKGIRNFYVSSDMIRVEYVRHCFRNNQSARYRGEKEWRFFQHIDLFYLYTYEFRVKE